ncbi:MAG: glycogen debranching protein GlgX [Dehalococcoidia bacterium]
MAIEAGEAYPLGATWDGEGTNFAVFSEVADYVELCLFDESGRETRVRLPEVTAFVHHGYVRDVGPGRHYGFRVHGPWEPSAGTRANPTKLLVDPYARAIDGVVRWVPAVFGHHEGDPGNANVEDSAPFVPWSVVTAPFFDWGHDRPPRTPLHHSLIYEAHVRGLTMRHPAVPPAERGTYAALAHPAVIEHLQRLGVTALELLPIHHFVPEREHVARGLTNYWGYNTLGYFAPHAAYASTRRPADAVREFKEAVRSLHAAGIEVILDVVYNHTAEGGGLGPTLSFRGLDNAAYYRLAEDRSHYVDYTGTGNTLNMRHPHVLQLIMDSLRYWITEMHVDGFRFDLAATLARELHDVDKLSAFFDIVQQDPVISRVKLIAEPWDLGEGGYQVGNFPPLWSEWNGRYRDTMRDVWRGGGDVLADFGRRLTGSADLYANTGRRPSASINFITAHDGFTLADLVAYDHKHNEANLEENRDGNDDNRSWNSGTEGATKDVAILERRARRARALLATLLLSQGTPMLLAGDELGHTQNGNNNAYCQDNELSWLDWAHADETLIEYVTTLSGFRRQHHAFHRRHWFEEDGQPTDIERDLGEIEWFTPDGEAMHPGDWHASEPAGLAMYMRGAVDPGETGESMGRRFLCLFNAGEEPRRFTVASKLASLPWSAALDSAHPTGGAPKLSFDAIEVGGWSVVVLGAP